MTPCLIIIALMLEPPESILETPWDYVTPYEYVDPKSFEDIEREIDEEHPIEAQSQ